MSDVRILHFWSPTCGPCKVIKPALEDIKEEFEGKIQWLSVNTKQDIDGLAQTYNVLVVPTIIVFKGNLEIARYSGTQISIIYQIIRKGLNA